MSIPELASLNADRLRDRRPSHNRSHHLEENMNTERQQPIPALKANDISGEIAAQQFLDAMIALRFYETCGSEGYDKDLGARAHGVLERVKKVAEVYRADKVAVKLRWWQRPWRYLRWTRR